MSSWRPQCSVHHRGLLVGLFMAFPALARFGPSRAPRSLAVALISRDADFSPKKNCTAFSLSSLLSSLASTLPSCAACVWRPGCACLYILVPGAPGAHNLAGKFLALFPLLFPSGVMIFHFLLFPTDSTLKKSTLFRVPFAGRLLLASTVV